MASTRALRSGPSGYSLIELLVVLAIVAILSIAGVTMLGNRGGNSVRVVLDELEGAIMDAHKYAATSGRDVAIVTWGQWDAASANPLQVARGVATQTSLAIQTVITAPPASPTDANASGKQNEDLTTVEPFKSDASFQAAVTAANNLFQGALNQVTISGANKRFNNSFMIQVVSTAGGFAVPAGAMGLIVVQNNGATVYRFYNPGAANGDGKWRRI